MIVFFSVPRCFYRRKTAEHMYKIWNANFAQVSDDVH